MENVSLPALCPNIPSPGQSRGRGVARAAAQPCLRWQNWPHSAGSLGPERLSLQGGMFISPLLELGHGVCPFSEVTAQLCQA